MRALYCASNVSTLLSNSARMACFSSNLSPWVFSSSIRVFCSVSMRVKASSLSALTFSSCARSVLVWVSWV